MCGRCMKTCPWNLEGLFAESGFRWIAMHFAEQRPLAGAAGRPARPRRHQPGEEVVVGHRTRPRHRRLRARRRRRMHAGCKPGLTLKLRGPDARGLPGRPHAAAVPGDAFRSTARRASQRYRALLDAGRIPRAPGARRDRRPGAAVPDARGRAAGVPGACWSGARTWRRRRQVRIRRPRRRPLPAFEAGAHIDVVIAPEYQRQYSLAGDPADAEPLGAWRAARSAQRPRGLGADASRLPRRSPGLRHRGRQSLPAARGCRHTLLMAGGIGVTPLLTMAHRLHALGRPFELHYSAPAARTAGFVGRPGEAPWRGGVQLHFKDEGRRADLAALIPAYAAGTAALHLRLGALHGRGVRGRGGRGLARRRAAPRILQRARGAGRVDHAFALRLARSGRTLEVPAGRSAHRRAGRRRHHHRREVQRRPVRRLRHALRRGQRPAKSNTATSCSAPRSGAARRAVLLACAPGRC